MRLILAMILVGIALAIKQHPQVLLSHDALMAIPAAVFGGYAYAAYRRTIDGARRRLRLAR